jgi:hypothetical protein
MARARQSWGQLVDGADAIVNLAGAGIADERWSSAQKRLLRQSRIDAGKAVMEAIAAAGARPDVLIRLPLSATTAYKAATRNSPRTHRRATISCPSSVSTGRLQPHRPASLACVAPSFVPALCSATKAAPSKTGNTLQVLRRRAGGQRQAVVSRGFHIDDQVRAIRFLIDNPKPAAPST